MHFLQCLTVALLFLTCCKTKTALQTHFKSQNFNQRNGNLQLTDDKITKLSSKFIKNSHRRHQRLAISGAILTVAAVHDPPYVVLRKTAGGIQAEGLDIETLNLVAKSLNFTYHLHQVDGNEYGEIVNGSWSGLFGVLQRKEADCGLPTFSPTILRNIAVDISAPVSSAFSMFLIRRPTANFDFRAYLSPFSLTLWCLMSLACVVSICGLIITLHYSSKMMLYLDTSPSQPAHHNYILQAITLCLSAISQRGYEPFPQQTSTRVVFSATLFFCMILMGCYNSILFAFLAVDNVQMPFDSLQTIVENADYRVGYVSGSAYSESLKSSQRTDGQYDDILHRLYLKATMFPENLVQSNNEGLRKAFTEKYAFLSWHDGLVYEIGLNCSFAFVKGKYFLRHYGIPFPKKSPYIKSVSIELLKLREAGILRKLQKKYFPPLQSFCAPEKVVKPMKFQHIWSVFSLFCIGALISAVLLFLEYIYMKLKTVLL